MAYLSFNPSVNSELKFTCGAEEAKRGEGANGDDGQDMALPCAWSIWEHLQQSADTNSNYADASLKAATFNSVSEFWKIWNHLPQPSELLEEQRRMVHEEENGLHIVDALMIFRDHIRPEWEDKMNAIGGHFQFQFKPSIGGGQIDEYWNNLVLGIIGEAIEPANMITGVRLVDKLSGPAKVIRLEVWFSYYESSEAVNILRRNVEKCMATRLDGSLGQAPQCETKQHQSVGH